MNWTDRTILRNAILSAILASVAVAAIVAGKGSADAFAFAGPVIGAIWALWSHSGLPRPMDPPDLTSSAKTVQDLPALRVVGVVALLLCSCATARINAVADSDTQGAQIESDFVSWSLSHEEHLRQSAQYRTAAKLLMDGFRQRAMAGPKPAINAMYTCLMNVGSAPGADATAVGCVLAARQEIAKFESSEALSPPADGGAHD